MERGLVVNAFTHTINSGGPSPCDCAKCTRRSSCPHVKNVRMSGLFTGSVDPAPARRAAVLGTVVKLPSLF